MKPLYIVLTLAVGAASGAVLAQSGQDVLKAKGCLNCHDFDKKKAGPSFKDVAAKHKKEDAGALVAKIKDGKGHPKSAASEAELKAAVDTVLSSK